MLNEVCLYDEALTQSQAQSFPQRAAPSITEIEREVRFEHRQLERVRESYRKTQAGAAMVATGVGQRLMQEVLPKFIKGVEAAQEEALAGLAKTGAGRSAAWWWLISLLPADSLALITLRAALSFRPSDASTARPVRDVANVIGQAVWSEFEFEVWKQDESRKKAEAKETGETYRDLVKLMKDRYPMRDAKAWRRWKEKHRIITSTPWTIEQRLQIGSFLVNLLADNSQGWFEVRTVILLGRKTEYRLTLSEEAIAALTDMETTILLAQPYHGPMVCPPKAWVWDAALKGYDGGYYMSREVLLRSGLHKHTLTLDRPISDETLTAVNAIQSTPWRVNSWVLEVIQELFLADQTVAGIPPCDPRPLPPKMDKEIWEGLDPTAKREYKKLRSEIHGENARMVSTRASFLSKLTFASELVAENQVFFPHFLDFRGRIYPISADLSPQSDDLSKGLLMFAEGKALGPTGLRWLAIRAANTFGLDKLTIARRIDWVWENTAKIRAVVEAPLDDLWWTEADEPVQFLATCREWVMALDCGSNVADFVSHLPINVDGTANGLQHLSAIGRDPVGAKATNMTDDESRNDIYEQVADVARRIVSDDAATGNDASVWWAGRITRSTVKRAVMTTPYGVTDRGVRDQLVDDGHVNDADRGDRFQYASYLKDVIVSSLGATVSSAKEIMAYIQGVAKVLVDHGYPLRWETPTGNTIQQTYYRLVRQKVSTMMGEIILWNEEPRAGLDSRKNMLAAAPNVIHSLDASALVKTVNATEGVLGSLSWSMIHDSYGTHACDMDTMSKCLRQEFVAMYQGDWLEDFERFIQSYAPDVDLPPRPRRGDFELEQVNHAIYFFA